MRDVLQRIRVRVERLAAGVACDGPHVLTKVSMVENGEPEPRWPPQGAAATCGRCGAELGYNHIIHVHVQDAHVAGNRR